MQTTNTLRPIGGTDISSIIGCNPWQSAFGLYQKIIGEAEPVKDNAAMERGRAYESVLGDLYEVENNIDLTEVFVSGINQLPHGQYDFIKGSPDVLYQSFDPYNKPSFGLEIKTADISQRQHYDFTASEPMIPMHYYLQCQWYAGLAKVDHWDFIVGFFVGDKMVSHESCSFAFNKKLYNVMVDEAVKFWETHIVPRNPPDDATPVEMESYYRRKFPQHTTGKHALRTTETDNTVVDYINRAKQIKELERLQQIDKSTIIMILKDCELLETPLGNVTYKTNKNTIKTDWENVSTGLSRFVDNEVFCGLVESNTKNTQGSRVLRFPRGA